MHRTVLGTLVYSDAGSRSIGEICGWTAMFSGYAWGVDVPKEVAMEIFAEDVETGPKEYGFGRMRIHKIAPDELIELHTELHVDRPQLVLGMGSQKFASDFIAAVGPHIRGVNLRSVVTLANLPAKLTHGGVSWLDTYAFDTVFRDDLMERCVEA